MRSNATNYTTYLLSLSLFFFSNPSFATCEYQTLIQGEQLSIGLMLKWSTSQEKDNAMFIIERSRDGVHYRNVGAVKGSGQSDQMVEYSFLDTNTSQEQCYYRLRQIDFSGVFDLSPVYIFTQKTPSSFSITSLNPTTSNDQLTLELNTPTIQNLKYELKDNNDKTLLTNSIATKSGSNTLKIEMTKYQAAVYKLLITVGSEAQSITFRKK